MRHKKISLVALIVSFVALVLSVSSLIFSNKNGLPNAGAYGFQVFALVLTFLLCLFNYLYMLYSSKNEEDAQQDADATADIDSDDNKQESE